MNITGNTFSNVFRAALFEDDPNVINFTGNTLNLHAIYNTNSHLVRHRLLG